MLALWLSLAWASPTTVIAVGDGVVAAGSPGAEAVSGWVSGLADCLQEESPGNYTVVDRQGPAVSVEQVGGWIRGIQKERRVVVLLGAGWSEGRAALDPSQLTRLIKGLRALSRPPAEVFVVSPVRAPSSVSAAEGSGLTALAQSPGVTLVDPSASLMQSGPGAMWSEGPVLSAQGHAAVAATVCDALRAWNDAPVESP